MSEQQYLLEMLDIEKQFPGVKALDHAKLQLRTGTVHALMGENGAGKSTLMKCLFGIYTRDGGTITMNGQPVTFTSPRDALDNGVAMVHQDSSAEVCPGQGIYLPERTMALPDQLSERWQTRNLQHPGGEKH